MTIQSAHPDVAATPIGFWQHPFVQNILPLLSSFMLHAGLLVVALLTYQAVQVVMKAPAREVRIDPVDPTLYSPSGRLDGFHGSGIDPKVRTFQNLDPSAEESSRGWNERRGSELASVLAGGSEPAESALESGMIGIGPGGHLGSGPRGRGTGHGDDIGAGQGDGGLIAPFGLPQIGGAPDGLVFQATMARRVAYVCDASGSMMNKFDPLRMEIRKAIDQLRPIQSFSIVFFQESNAAFTHQKLLTANPGNKRLAFDFLDRTSAHGATDPIAGLKLAFSQHPQLIYLLTDGDFPDNQKVLEFIRTTNRDGAVQINTIAFVDRGAEYEQVLRTIAAENRGVFRYVAEDQLGH